MVAELMAQMPQTITTHNYRFRLQIRYGIKQLYPIYRDSENTCFVGYFLTEYLGKNKKQKQMFQNLGVWHCPRLAEKQRIHEYTDALLAIPLMFGTNYELEKTLENLGKTLVNDVNGHTNQLPERY